MGNADEVGGATGETWQVFGHPNSGLARVLIRFLVSAAQPRTQGFPPPKCQGRGVSPARWVRRASPPFRKSPGQGGEDHHHWHLGHSHSGGGGLQTESRDDSRGIAKWKWTLQLKQQFGCFVIFLNTIGVLGSSLFEGLESAYSGIGPIFGGPGFKFWLCHIFVG